MKIFLGIYVVTMFALVIAPACKTTDLCDQRLAGAVKTCQDTGLESFSCERSGKYSYSCKELPEATVVTTGEPRQLVVIEDDGVPRTRAIWPAGTFRDMKVVIRYQR